MRREIRIAGAGGHGVLTGAVILAHALGRAGYHVAQTQHYGPEARGGLTVADIVWSDKPINFQGVMALDILLALTQEGADHTAKLIKNDGTVIIDPDEVKTPPRGKTFGAPILKSARDEFGAETFAGVMTLGVIAALTNICDEETLKTAITERLGVNSRDKNLAIFKMGQDLGQKASANPLPPPFEADL